MEQKSNVQLNSKCKIIDISQKYSCRGNPNFLFGETTQNRCGKTPERYCATGCSCLLFRWYYPDFTLLGYFKRLTLRGTSCEAGKIQNFQKIISFYCKTCTIMLRHLRKKPA